MNPPAMQQMWVRSLGWEDPLEEGMAAHSSILAWRIPYTEEPGGLQSMGLQRIRHNQATKHNTRKEGEIEKEERKEVKCLRPLVLESLVAQKDLQDRFFQVIQVLLEVLEFQENL